MKKEKQSSFGSPVHPKDWEQKREIYYEKYLGSLSDIISHDTSLTLPHIDIYTISPDQGRNRPHSTLITSGMSDQIQIFQNKNGETVVERIEILWYIEMVEDWMLKHLVWLAKYPFVNNTRLGYFHTLENGFPQINSSSELTNLILLPPLFENIEFGKGLVLDGIKVSFLWLFPITHSEMRYKLEKGGDAFLDLMEEKKPPIAFDPDREAMI